MLKRLMEYIKKIRDLEKMNDVYNELEIEIRRREDTARNQVSEDLKKDPQLPNGLPMLYQQRYAVGYPRSYRWFIRFGIERGDSVEQIVKDVFEYWDKEMKEDIEINKISVKHG